MQERENLLQCSQCGKYAHQSCLVPPIGDFDLEEWACHLCKDRTVQYLPSGTNIVELQKRFSMVLWYQCHNFYFNVLITSFCNNCKPFFKSIEFSLQKVRNKEYVIDEFFHGLAAVMTQPLSARKN